MVKKITYLIYVSIVIFCILEIFFRFFPVSDSLRVRDVSSVGDRYYFKPNQTFNRQIGYDFKYPIIKKTNNYGYFTNHDFKKNLGDTENLVVVIGDSYVEALQVANDDTFHSELANEYSSHFVYPIGASGAPLSQYLTFAQFAEKEFNPDKYIFTIIQNDFDESWYSKYSMGGFSYFNKNEELLTQPYLPSNFKKLARNSAFLRWLHIDFKLSRRIKSIVSRLKQSMNLQNKIQTKELNFKTFTEASDLFLKRLPKIIGSKPVLFLVNGDKKSIYMNLKKRNLKDSLQSGMHYFIKEASKIDQFLVLDLQEIFVANWNGQPNYFDFEFDSHWNKRTHKFVADVIIQSNFVE